MTNHQSAILSVRNLSKFFGGNRAVNDVNFDVNRGELLALIGPNGAGKTTCFNMLMGQLKRTSGEVQLNGEDISDLPTREIWRKGVGRTFQITATYASMTVIENVQMALLSHHCLFGNSIVCCCLVHRTRSSHTATGVAQCGLLPMPC